MRTPLPEEIGGKQMSKWNSRKFVAAVFSGLFIVLNEGLELGIPDDVYWYIAGIAMVYILGQSFVDATGNK